MLGGPGLRRGSWAARIRLAVWWTSSGVSAVRRRLSAGAVIRWDRGDGPSGFPGGTAPAQQREVGNVPR